MANFLEQLVAEWYEYTGYYVRRNVHVGRRTKGGFDGELDIVAFNPTTPHLVHIEPSMDTLSWEKREARFEKKFRVGLDHIPKLFNGFDSLPKVEQIALFAQGSQARHPTIGGGKVMMVKDFIAQIRVAFANQPIESKAVPEQFVILRTLQFAANYWR